MQLDVTLAKQHDFERVLEGPWDNKVQDFCVRSTTRERMRQDAYVDLAILSKEGVVYEVSVDTTKNKIQMLSLKHPVTLLNKTTVPISQLPNYTWLSLVEVELDSKPQTLRKQGGYLIHGYNFSERRNVLLYTDSDSQVIVEKGAFS